MSKRLLTLILALCSVQMVNAENRQCCGKLEVAPAFLHIDVLENEKTIHKLDLPAVRVEGNWLIYKGLTLKPTVLYGSNDGDLFSGQLGLGYCIPWKQFVFTPSAGCGYTSMNTRTNLTLPPLQLQLRHKKENFKSASPYISFDVTWNFCEKWRIAGSVQYIWSRTHTVIKDIPMVNQLKINSRSQGPAYSALLEYDISPEWSVNLGAAYNVSLDREKFGLRGYGFKLGIAYWFYSNNCCE